MKNKALRSIILLLVLAIITGCLEEPEFKGISNFKVKEFNKEHILFDMDVKVYNPNNKKIKVRNSELKLYINGSYVGNAMLLDKYKMDKKTITLKNVPVEIRFENGVLFSLLNIVTNKSVKIRLEGVLKASVSGVPMRRKIDQTKELNLKELGINLGGLGLGKLLGK